MGEEEKDAALRVLSSGWLAQGNEVAAFENEVCDFLGLPHDHAVALSSGSAALYLAQWALGAANKRVACPVYACSALTNAISLAHAQPLLLDCGADSPNVDVDALARCGADLAVVPHMFGLPVDLRDIGMPLIEDCAQAIGAAVAGIPVGLQGDIGIFSFSATKLMTSGGQGGMLVSRHQDLVDAVRDYRQFDMRHDHHARFNFQMTDTQAAIGRVQLAKLPGFIARRVALFERYRNVGMQLLDCTAPAVPVRYRAVARLEHPKALLQRLEANGIRAIVPVEDWELLGESSENFPNALAMSRTTVSLPVYPTLSDANQDRILEILQS